MDYRMTNDNLRSATIRVIEPAHGAKKRLAVAQMGFPKRDENGIVACVRMWGILRLPQAFISRALCFVELQQQDIHTNETFGSGVRPRS